MEIGQKFSYGHYSQLGRQTGVADLSKTALGAKSVPPFTVVSVRDEYIPLLGDSPVSLTEKKGLSALSINGAITQVLKKYDVSENESFALGLVIDKTGQFQSGGGSVNQQGYNWDDPDQGELGAIINDLNKTTVNGIPLAEAMLKKFAQESGMDLNTERKKDSFYFTCQIINPMTSLNAEKKSDSFTSVSIPVVTVDNKFYSSEADEPNIGLCYHYGDNGELVKKTVDGDTRAWGLNAMDAPWNRDNSMVEKGGFDGTDALAQFENAKTQKNRREFTFDTDALDTAIQIILKDIGYELKSGDSVVFDISNAFVFSFDRNCSQIAEWMRKLSMRLAEFSNPNSTPHSLRKIPPLTSR